MRLDELTGTEGGFIAGALAVVLLGAIISVLSMPIRDLMKLAYLIYDIGIVGLSFGLLNEAFEGERSDAIRAAFAIAGTIVLLALRL
ncbi:hypothetical protein [Thermococcus gammatolerans]|uniref:Uncharacterized protein n=1 Tax=Thermococcus gammatolerans (strain DSM 15229 / JCM 11827 / EJ3) TaxID=593117 RepID=C5A7K2_THEGJ|nr:hypothetical protein [Thermococcus gammatolerans]ACS34214.1 Conserved hypothetical protein [Thermococcus gammatolerans EJ3]